MGLHSTPAYFEGRAYMMSILKNPTRAYFQVGSYYRGNRVTAHSASTDEIWHRRGQEPSSTPILSFTGGPRDHHAQHALKFHSLSETHAKCLEQRRGALL